MELVGELDGLLRVGVDIPSAEQVQEMEKETMNTGTTIMQAWRRRKSMIGSSGRPDDHAGARRLQGGMKKSVSGYHDFRWSRSLWKHYAQETGKCGAFLLGIYLLLGYFLLCVLSDFDGIISLYFLSATLSTVGFGDFAPRSQLTRGFAVVLIPFGLAILGLVISFAVEIKRSKPRRVLFDPSSPEEMKKIEQNSLFEAIDRDNDGSLTREEVVAGAPLLGMSEEEASHFFDKLDVDRTGALSKLTEGGKSSWFDTIQGRMIVLLAQLYLPVAAGALFFLLFQPEEKLDLTVIDALYFATVTVTSVGFGDITPATDGGRLFMIFMMMAGTVWVGGVLGEFLDLYVNEVVGGGIVSAIIDSTTWLHKCDIYNKGFLTEADYVMFKVRGR